MLTTDDLFDYFQHAIRNSWKSKGNFYFQVYPCEKHYHLNVFPAIREIYGGPSDGKVGFAGFEFNIKRFSKAFDKEPKVKFHSSNGECVISMVGKVNKKKIQTLIFPFPLDGMEAQEVQYAVGPKRGTVEAKVYEEDESSMENEAENGEDNAN